MSDEHNSEIYRSVSKKENNEVQVKLGVGAGFKFGFGFGAGIFIWSLLLTVIMLAIFSAVGASMPRM
jgi:hypothetical protein